MNLDMDLDIDSEEDVFPEEMLHSPLEGIADSVITDIMSRQVRFLYRDWYRESCCFILKSIYLWHIMVFVSGGPINTTGALSCVSKCYSMVGTIYSVFIGISIFHAPLVTLGLTKGSIINCPSDFHDNDCHYRQICRISQRLGFHPLAGVCHSELFWQTRYFCCHHVVGAPLDRFLHYAVPFSLGSLALASTSEERRNQTKEEKEFPISRRNTYTKDRKKWLGENCHLLELGKRTWVMGGEGMLRGTLGPGTLWDVISPWWTTDFHAKGCPKERCPFSDSASIFRYTKSSTLNYFILRL